jgi:hypothetical protein
MSMIMTSERNILTLMKVLASLGNLRVKLKSFKAS